MAVAKRFSQPLLLFKVVLLLFLFLSVFFVIVYAQTAEYCDSENIVQGTGGGGTACDGSSSSATGSDDGTTRTILEYIHASKKGYIEAYYDFSTTENEADVTQLDISINAWTTGESISVFIYNYTSSSYIDTGINITATSDGTTYTASLCSSGCGISVTPADFIDGSGNMQLYYDDDIEDRNEPQDTLSIDLQQIEVTIPSGELTVDIVDSGGSSVSSPSVAMSSIQASHACQSATGTFGTSSERIRVTNTTGTANWTLTIAASDGDTATWSSGTYNFDYNDGAGATAGCSDGGDTDSYAGQLTLDPSVATITPESGCSTTGLSLGDSSSFEEGTTNSITLLSADGSADTGCYWDLTGVSISQQVPGEQPADNYSIDMTLTVASS